MRREILYLTDILDAADHIAKFIDQTDQEAFLQSELTRSAVTQKLIVIGEAAAKISPETAMRTHIFHGSKSRHYAMSSFMLILELTGRRFGKPPARDVPFFASRLMEFSAR